MSHDTACFVHALVDVLAPGLSSNQIKPSQAMPRLAGRQIQPHPLSYLDRFELIWIWFEASLDLLEAAWLGFGLA